jgi:phosphoglycerate dehydrogenase-like enzyme
MKIVVSEGVARAYGARIREVHREAELIAPSAADRGVAWTGDFATADVCCFTADLWEDLELRRTVLPSIFRIEGLKWFHTFSAGVDSPVFQTLIDRGTLLTNSSGASAKSIAQYVLAMMLYRAKRIGDWRDQQRLREWTALRTDELTGRTVCIVGTGAIGGETARLARAFGMRVIGVRRSARRTRYVDEQVTPRGLRDALARSDYVVLACPLTRETAGLIGERELLAMKPDATLINVARGGVIDEPALVRALKEGWIGGACLDVFAQEPLPAESEIWDMPNVVVSPHNAGFSPLNMERVMAIFLDNLDRYARGRPLRNRVLKAGV